MPEAAMPEAGEAGDGYEDEDDGAGEDEADSMKPVADDGELGRVKPVLGMTLTAMLDDSAQTTEAATVAARRAAPGFERGAHLSLYFFFLLRLGPATAFFLLTVLHRWLLQCHRGQQRAARGRRICEARLSKKC